MKLTAFKKSRFALARGNSGEGGSRDGRGDFGALVGVASVAVASVGVASGFGGVVVGRAGSGMVGVVVGKGTCSCKSDKGESRDDFELHIVFFFCCKAEH